MIGNRRDDIGLLVAACDTYQDVHFVDTGTTAGIVEFMSDSFKSEWHKNMDQSQLQMIPCMPLSSILAKFGAHQLDFWSLDVEGGEMQGVHPRALAWYLKSLSRRCSDCMLAS